MLDRSRLDSLVVHARSRLGRNPAGQQTETRQTFDRSKQFDFVPADRCLEGISAICSVKAGFVVRHERTLFGAVQKRRLLALTGSANNVGAALWLYDMIEETLDASGEAYAKAHRHAVVAEVVKIQVATAKKINERLKELVAAPVLLAAE